MPPDLTLSIISADNLSLLLPCLRSVFRSTHCIRLEVFVVDNASSDSTADAVMSEFPQVTVIRNAQRLGFSTNNNLVLQQGQGRYLMLLNDDTVVLGGALDVIVGFADSCQDAGVIGGWLLNSDGSFQRSFSYLPNPWIEAFWSTAAFSPHLHRNAREPFSVETVSGAALMIRRETMRHVGLLDTAFDPIYAEETDWCFRVRKGGWQVFTHPQARIIHYGSQTMSRMPARKVELLQSHKVRYFRKHYGALPASYFKVTLLLSSVLKYIRASLPGREPKVRDEARLHLLLAQRSLRF